MYLVSKSKYQIFSSLNLVSSLKQHQKQRLCHTKSSLQELCGIVSATHGSLDDLESRLDSFKPSLTSSLVTQVIESCKTEAPSRRLLRFFLWSNKNLETHLRDDDFNHAIRVFAAKRDHTAMKILTSDLKRDGRAMESQTYSVVAETLVKLGREEEALGMFKNLGNYKCPRDRSSVTAIVNALCAHGHAKMAEGVLKHHKEEDEEEEVKQLTFRSLVYGWCEREEIKEARRVIKEMKSSGVMPDLFCYNTFLRCLCERNLKRNPSGLVPEALNIMMEMRSYQIDPNPISYNILLSCLGRTRRVKESCQILERMKRTGCSPDWVSYYLVIRVLYLSMRFGKGNSLLDEMLIEKKLVPNRKFYYELIGVLCGVERPFYALELFDRMKKSEVGGCGPVYDMLIPKFCIGGDFEKGRELWDEAVNMGVEVRCSKDFLDPLKTEVFKPNRQKEADDISLVNKSVEKNLQKPYERKSNVKHKKKKKTEKKKLKQKQKKKLRGF